MGSICSAVIVCRLFGLPDPRLAGSKNPGATNVLRLAGKQYAIIVLIGDLLKGTIPVLIAKIFTINPTLIGFTALAAVVGHMYPIFFEFKGGKGVATALGALLGFQFIIGVMTCATWLLVANFSRFSSLASIVSLSLAPFYTLFLIGQPGTFPPLFTIALLVVLKHRQNITQLINGTEPKIKLKIHKDHNIIDEIIEPQSNVIALDNEEVAPVVEVLPVKKVVSKKPSKPKTAKKAAESVTKPNAVKAKSTETVKEKPAKKAPKAKTSP